MRMRLAPWACAGSLAALSVCAWAQQAEGIFTCVDAKGRRLTSDRPIPECIDREQKVLGSTGTVRRVVPPTLTATELEAKADRDRKLAEEQARQAEERRADRALVARYPNQAAHDAERAKALQTMQDVIAAGRLRTRELQDERKKIMTETEFYKNPAQYPPKLKRQLADNQQQIAAQTAFVASQEEEKQRVSRRFDEELAKLRTLWAQRQLPAAASR